MGNLRKLRAPRAVMLQALLVGVIACPAWGQTGSIAGTVSDSSGAMIPNVSVTATEESTGFKRQTLTNEAGQYNLPVLPVGTWSIQAEAGGFRKYVRSGFGIVLGQNATLDITLEVGDVSQEISVTAEAPLLNTRTSEVSALMDPVRMTELPLNGRNAIQLAGLLPGVAGVNAPQFWVGGSSGGVTLNVTGSRLSHNAMLFDGSNYAQLFRNNGYMYPAPDTLREFKVVTNMFSAEYGTSGGGVLNAITRSGTNDFHGNFYEFFRNDNLNARNFFLPRKSNLNQNQFGLTSGGPIVRNKLFYFGSLEFLKVRSEAASVSAFPPTEAERNGIFPASQPVRDPVTGEIFPGNQIPVSRFDPVAKAVLGRYLPVPNQPDGRYITTAASPVNTSQYLIKLDYQPSARHTFYNRFFTAETTQAQPLGSSNLPDYSPGEQRNKAKINNITSWTSILSNSLVNEFRFSIFQNETFTTNFNKISLADLGGAFPDIEGHPKMPPTLEVSGRFNLRPQGESFGFQDTYEVHDNVSWQKKSHSLKFGGLWFLARFRNAIYDIARNGRFAFDRSITGNALGDFLLGKPASMSIISPNYSRETPGSRFGFYFADDWRVTPELTLNIGLRYEFSMPWTESRGYWSTLYRNSGFQSTRFPGAPVDMAFLGDPGVPEGLIEKDLNNFQPRVGFAYSPGWLRKTVFRGGFGVFSEHNNVDIIQNTGQPFQFNQTYFAINQLSTPLAGLGTLPLVVDPKTAIFKPPFSIFFPDPDYRDGYTYQFNFMVQREFGSNLSVEAGYVGKLSRKLTGRLEVNPAVYVPGQSSLSNIEQRRVYRPGLYSGIEMSCSCTNATYNSLQVQVIRRLARGFSLQGAYTFSKSLDHYSGDVVGGRLPNPFDRRSVWGPSDFDSTHNGNVTFVAELPNAGNSAFHKALLHNWQVSGIFTARTGTPFTVYSGRDIALSATSDQTANVVGNPERDHANKDDALRMWFNTAAFTNPPTGTFGNSGRNNVRGPSRWNLDSGIFRNFPIDERFRLQFRSEFFSVFNHLSPGNPGNSLAATQTFGRILSGGGSRVIQFALKLYY